MHTHVRANQSGASVHAPLSYVTRRKRIALSSAGVFALQPSPPPPPRRCTREHILWVFETSTGRKGSVGTECYTGGDIFSRHYTFLFFTFCTIFFFINYL